uniref:AlNc14C360G10987 protein n=1 Tax=Albugo laibachii Nc14 TaxID=890382 RepID=F0WXQ1_9STRA|nr:AlNc14C360G10987 [Albugo laibachii Nc14]|eukprot:CCA26247.1 AlNc14C360G10987 [Albugo laibachii Nc14]
MAKKNGILPLSTIEEHLYQRLPAEYRITTETVDCINDCVTEFLRVTTKEANRLAELGATREHFRVQESHLSTAANNLQLQALLTDVDLQKRANRHALTTKRKRDRAKMSGNEQLIAEQKKLFELASIKAKSEGWQ